LRRWCRNANGFARGPLGRDQRHLRAPTALRAPHARGLAGQEEQDGGHVLPARVSAHGIGDTSGLVSRLRGHGQLYRVYLGAFLHCDFLHESTKPPKPLARFAIASAALAIFPSGLREKCKQGGVLAVLLSGCESLCLTVEAITRMRNWNNKRIREMRWVIICQSLVHRITSVSL
jgi:hypothetical protein